MGLIPLLLGCSTVSDAVMAHSAGNQPVVIVAAGSNTGFQVDPQGLKLGRQHLMVVYAIGPDGKMSEFTFELEDSEAVAELLNGMAVRVTVTPVEVQPEIVPLHGDGLFDDE